VSEKNDMHYARRINQSRWSGIHMPEVIFKNIRLSSPHEIIAVTARVPEMNLSPVRIVTGMSLAQIPSIVKT
jgi:hypothetical protein